MANAEKSASSGTVYFKGSCVCKRITYDCTEAPTKAQNCHCTTCRKLSGGPYQSFTDVRSKAVILCDDKERLRYEGLPKDDMGGISFLRLSPVAERAFCVTCHTPLAMRYHHDYHTIGLTLGTIDEESVADDKTREALKPDMHIFVSQKVWWVDLEKDALPAHERFSGNYEDEMKAWQGKQG